MGLQELGSTFTGLGFGGLVACTGLGVSGWGFGLQGTYRTTERIKEKARSLAVVFKFNSSLLVNCWTLTLKHFRL